MTPVIEVRNLTKHYEDFTLDNISLEIPAGCITGIFGPSGAGKTTLIKLIANQTPPSGGSVRLFGLSYADREREIKNRIGYLAQEPSFYWSKSVRWTARFVSRFYPRWDRTRFQRLLEEFGVNPFKKLKNLSRGQKTLVSLAIALSHDADLLLLDEPSAGLDMVLRRRILARLRDFVADGDRTVVISSHITDGLDDVAETIRFLDDGRLVLQADKDDLLASWKRIHFRDGALGPEVVDRLTDIETQPFGNSGLTRDFPAIRAQLDDGIASGEVKVANASLDDILIALLKGA